MIRFLLSLTLLDACLTAQPRDLVHKEAVQRATASYFSNELEVWRKGPKSAASHYEKSLGANPNGPLAARAAIGLGVVRLLRNDTGGALRKFQEAATYDPQSFAIASLWMGLAHRQAGKFGLADRHLWNAVTHQDPATDANASLIKETYSRFLEEQSRSSERSEIDRFLGYDRKTQTAEVYGVGPGIQKPRIRFRAEPVSNERTSNTRGWIPVSVDVHLDGRPRNIQVLRRLDRELDKSIHEAIYQWRFQPGTVNGQPAVVTTVVEVSFGTMLR